VVLLYSWVRVSSYAWFSVCWLEKSPLVNFLVFHTCVSKNQLGIHTHAWKIRRSFKSPPNPRSSVVFSASKSPHMLVSTCVEVSIIATVGPNIQRRYLQARSTDAVLVTKAFVLDWQLYDQLVTLNVPQSFDPTSSFGLFWWADPRKSSSRSYKKA